MHKELKNDMDSDDEEEEGESFDKYIEQKKIIMNI